MIFRIFNSKRSQVSSGITWFVGFLIIFFIIFLFVSASLIISAKRKVPVFGEAESKIEIEKTRGSLIETENLIAILNSPIKECFFVKNPDARSALTDAIKRRDFSEDTYYDVIKLFMEGKPKGRIERVYLFPSGDYRYGVGYLKAMFEKEGDYAYYARMFAECVESSVKDIGLDRRSFRVNFPNGGYLETLSVYQIEGAQAIALIKVPLFVEQEVVYVEMYYPVELKW